MSHLIVVCLLILAFGGYVSSMITLVDIATWCTALAAPARSPMAIKPINSTLLQPFGDYGDAFINHHLKGANWNVSFKSWPTEALIFCHFAVNIVDSDEPQDHVRMIDLVIDGHEVVLEHRIKQYAIENFVYERVSIRGDEADRADKIARKFFAGEAFWTNANVVRLLTGYILTNVGILMDRIDMKSEPSVGTFKTVTRQMHFIIVMKGIKLG